jgi:tRNA (cmo5U34)-methyltransferase
VDPSIPHPSSRGFDRLAPFYDDLAGLVFGQQMIDAQTCYLNAIPTHSKVLMLGGGTGWILQELLKINSTLEVWYIDSSPKMLELASQRLNGNNQVQFILGTEANIPQGIDFDVLITHFFLDQFSDLELSTIINHLTKLMRPEVKWLVADFVPSPKTQHQILSWMMHTFFRWSVNHPNKSLVNWENAMAANGWTFQSQQYFFQDFMKSGIMKQINNSSSTRLN